MALSPKHHAELNKITASRAHLAELRREYAGDAVALQQIDVYDPESRYHPKLRALIQAQRRLDHAAMHELEAWFKENYPDV